MYIHSSSEEIYLSATVWSLGRMVSWVLGEPAAEMRSSRRDVEEGKKTQMAILTHEGIEW